MDHEKFYERNPQRKLNKDGTLQDAAPPKDSVAQQMPDSASVRADRSARVSESATTSVAATDSPTPLTEEAWISLVIRDLAELPDRNSPEDIPEALVVTPEELSDAIKEHCPARDLERKLAEAEREIARHVDEGTSLQLALDKAYSQLAAQQRDTLKWIDGK